MGATVVSVIVASHELATQFNSTVAAVVEKRAAILKELRAQAEAAYAKLTREYAWEAKDVSSEPFLAQEAKGKEPIRLVRKWTNKADFDKVRATYGVAYRDEPDVVLSVPYYRFSGLLVAANGSGAQLLKANQRCSELEWELITKGDVPSKFIT